MAVQKKTSFLTCEKCGQSLGVLSFTKTKNKMCCSGYLPICNSCLQELVYDEIEKARQDEGEDLKEWKIINKLCQWIDVPFNPARWVTLYNAQGARAIIPYLSLFTNADYDGIDWDEQQKIYRQLEKEGKLSNEVVPGYNDKEIALLQQKWGANYCAEDLFYLENLYNGVLTTQSVNGALQTDQAIKLCKLSLTIDSRIREGQDIDKLLASYEKLVKVAEFTPKNVKNAQDFDSVGEVFAYLEKKGFVNKFYDGAKRDVVDVTMNNIQNFCQRLYVQESGIGEDIEKRIESLKSAKEIEDNMGIADDYTSESMNQEIEEYFEQEEFNPEA